MSRMYPSFATGQFDCVNTIYTSGLFPPHRSKTNKKGNKGKMADNATFKVVVKNGDTEYKVDQKTGQYKTKTIDYVYEATSLAEALGEFLSYVNDDYNEDKVSLVVTPAKKGKK